MASNFSKHILRRILKEGDFTRILDEELKPLREYLESSYSPGCPCNECENLRMIIEGLIDQNSELNIEEAIICELMISVNQFSH